MTPQSVVNGAFIYLFGFAGSGKLTIAKAIAERWDCVLVDNHSINNVIFAVIDLDQEGSGELSDQVWDAVIRVRHAALDAIRKLSRPGRNFIFTNELIEGVDRHHVWFHEVAQVAADRGALFLPVRLLVDPEELERRIASPEREEKLKLTSPEAARARSENEDVFRPEGYDYLELDVTTLEPEAAAERVLGELHRRLGTPSRAR
jgi:predicted kinase